MPELQAPPVKRRRRGEQVTNMILNEEPAGKNALSAAPQDDETSSQEFPLPRRRTTSYPSQALEASQSQSSSKDTPKDMDLDCPLETSKPQRTQVLPSQNQISTKHQSRPRSQSNANEWLVVAPKDDATRKALWEKASKANAEKMDGAHFKPPALSKPSVTVTAPSTNTTNTQSSHLLSLRERRTNGPDFRRFRKNIVPRQVDESELIVVQAVQAKESQQQLRLQENQRELEKQQRLADELFREIGGGTTRRRRR